MSLAISIAIAWGRKPIEISPACGTASLSTQDSLKIERLYIERLKAHKQQDIALDAETLAYRIWQHLEKPPLLSEVFADINFYQAQDYFRRPPRTLYFVVTNNKIYNPIIEFNQLLINHGIEINENNIITLAKAFVLIASSEFRPFPEITFLEGKRIKEYDRKRACMMDVEIKCRIDDGEVQTWKFSQSRDTPQKGKWVKVGQFSGVTVYVKDKPVRRYQIKRATKETGRGKSEKPKIEIDVSMSNATVEQDSFFYLITYRNGEPTEYSVRFRLSNFEPNEKDVYIKIEPIEGYSYGPCDTIGPVEINENGEGYFDWSPSSEIQTGISFVCAGNIPPEDTFSKRTEYDKSLTLEKVITGRFHNSYPDTFTVYYTDQFFYDLNQGSNYPTEFAECIKNAVIESWLKQVAEWSLAQGLPGNKPQDADLHHRFFVIDTLNWYHGDKYTPGSNHASWTLSGPNREIWLRYDAKHRWGQCYTNLDLLIRSVISHEFYHGIQYGHNPQKWVNPLWDWFTEGQAKCLQSVQYQGEEFLDNLHQYPARANMYLNEYLNRSLSQVSYHYCLYWREILSMFVEIYYS